jgi:hypothetical protein
MQFKAQPLTISIHHNGREVCRNEAGQWIEVPLLPDLPEVVPPHRIQIFFDGMLVYDLKQGVVEKNDLRHWLQSPGLPL